ncbi:Restriction endonuclease [Arsukibacterium tuosuense]|uniref:Restriction endonuclease n=1 Tax=Arsukibacterium tuosuense TaxID=1323745 RepID=A0A285JBN4_9GAMM|nr:restriction endonuclease [Arsukibacterium tuosuense]SNY57503.1 Restriction endonuclease [Arsukibacterium tuosuense]
MKSKWLWVSSISTLIGILAGGIYLFFAEHSLLLSDKDLTLSAFWSTFMLWAFVLMFVVALLCNVLAFMELDDEHRLAGVNQRLRTMLAGGDRQQQFLLEAQRLLSRKGRWSASDRIAADYQLLHAQRDTLVFVQQGCLPVDITQVRAMFQQMLAIDISDGIVVSSGGFSNQAWIFAQEANISLLDSKSLRKQQKRAKIQQVPIIQS